MTLRVVPGWREQPVVPDRPTEVVTAWRAASVAGGWAFPGDWWCPAVEAVAEALAEPAGLPAACGELGATRARAGVTLGELLDDLDALAVTLPRSRRPTRPARRAAVLAWAEATGALLAGASCADPLSLLTTVAYLRTRLGEVYREADRSGTDPGSTHALVVVRLEPGAGPTRWSVALVVGEVLRTVFSGGETLCAAGPAHTLALVAREPLLVSRLGALRRLFDERAGWVPRIWVERLPAGPGAALGLLEEFTR